MSRNYKAAAMAIESPVVMVAIVCVNVATTKPLRWQLNHLPEMHLSQRRDRRNYKAAAMAIESSDKDCYAATSKRRNYKAAAMAIESWPIKNSRRIAKCRNYKAAAMAIESVTFQVTEYSYFYTVFARDAITRQILQHIVFPFPLEHLRLMQARTSCV